VTKASFGIDDTSFGYDCAPYIRKRKGDPKSEDPGENPEFSMADILPPNQKTYHNYILFRYSEPIKNFDNVTLDASSDNYNFSTDQRSTASLGDFENDTDRVNVKGFGNFNGNIRVDAGANFILRDDERTTFLHVAGFYDGAKFVGHITNQSSYSVPDSTKTNYFTTIDNLNVTDYMNLGVKQKNIVGNTDLTIDYLKDWDITPPDFRFIAATATYRGDPISAGTVTSKLSDGATYGTPLISSIEFAMTEAIRDLPVGHSMTDAFMMKFYKNGEDGSNAANLSYSTIVNKLADLINNYNGVSQNDADPNDQGFSIYFDKVVGMNDEAQIKWTYNATDGKIISDLRGNMLPNVETPRLSIENAPPYIKETRAVAGSNKMYVEFNEPVLNKTYKDITVNDFNYVDAINNTNVLIGLEKIDINKYIFTFAENLDQNHIAEDSLSIKPGEVQDTLSNVVKSIINSPLSYIGINFFTNVTLEDFLHQGEGWKITNFDGDEKISVENMKVTANINVNKFKNFRPILYFDVLSEPEFWYPNVNRESRMILGNSKGDNNWEFIIPS
nr:hypothetical protein [Spirochaetota bacterium]